MPKVSFDVLSNWEPAHADLYNVYFEGSDSQSTQLNAMQIGKGSGDYIFPATSVEEHLYQIQYEEIRLIDGLVLPFPIEYQEYGYITVTFQEKRKWDVHRYIKQWGDKWVSGGDGIVANPDDMVLTLVIERLDLQGNVTTKSKYGVLPPDSLRATNSQANDIVSNSLSFKVVQLYEMFNTDEGGGGAGFNPVSNIKSVGQSADDNTFSQNAYNKERNHGTNPISNAFKQKPGTGWRG